MEQRKRNHPHNRKEWEEKIRPVFTALYRDRDRKLSDIVDIMKGHGFQAKECHYKRYISKWGLERNNKQSDMVFAFQKLQERQEQDTIFSIRGQKRTRDDVERYWKRRRPNPADFSPVPDTPEGIEYGTPSTCPSGDTSGPGTERAVEEPTSSSFVIRSSLDVAPMNNQLLLINSRPTSIRLLNSPGSLRLHDQALYYLKVYFQSYVERAPRDRDVALRREEEYDLWVFEKNCRALLVAVTPSLGFSQVNVECAKLDVFKLLPKIAQTHHPVLMATLLYMVAACSHYAQNKVVTSATTLSREIMSAIARLHVEGRSLVMTLQAASRSFSGVSELSQRLLLAAKDILAQNLGDEHSETCNLLRFTCCAFTAAEDWNAALRSANDLHQIKLSRLRTNKTDDTIVDILDSKADLVNHHLQLGNDGEAQDLIDDGLRNCGKVVALAVRHDLQSRLLLWQGVIEAQQGRLTAAEKSLTKALTTRLRLHGAGDHIAVIAAAYLKWTLEEQRRRMQVVKAGFDPQRQECPLFEVENHTDESRCADADGTTWDEASDRTTEEATAWMSSGEMGDSDAVGGNPEAALPMVEVGEEPSLHQEVEMWTNGQEVLWTAGQEDLRSHSQAVDWTQQGERSHTMDWTDDFDEL